MEFVWVALDFGILCDPHLNAFSYNKVTIKKTNAFPWLDVVLQLIKVNYFFIYLEL